MIFDRILPLFRTKILANDNVSALANEVIPGACDLKGNLFTRTVIVDGAGDAFTPTYVSYNDNLTPPSLILPSAAFLYAFDGVNADRLRTVSDDTDGQAALTLGTQVNVTRLQGWNGATFDRVRSQGDDVDAVAATSLGHLSVWGHSGLNNGTTWDRARNNVAAAYLASAVRAVTTNSSNVTNYNGRGVSVIVDMTVVPGVTTVTPSIQVFDQLTGKYVPVLTGAAIINVSTVRLTVYPGITAVANISASDALNRQFRIVMTHSGAGNFTYSVSGTTIL
jgi:hypothetical protein